MLDPFAQLFQHCWGHARSLRMGYKDLWVVSFPRFTVKSQQCWELLHPLAHHCQHGSNNSQHSRQNNVGSCCVRLHAALLYRLCSGFRFYFPVFRIVAGVVQWCFRSRPMQEPNHKRIVYHKSGNTSAQLYETNAQILKLIELFLTVP